MNFEKQIIEVTIIEEATKAWKKCNGGHVYAEKIQDKTKYRSYISKSTGKTKEVDPYFYS